MFQLVCDPSGVVVETTLKELLPAVINWGSKLDHVLRVLLSHIVSAAQVCFFLTISYLLVRTLSFVLYNTFSSVFL
jgi:hypothetical protein